MFINWRHQWSNNKTEPGTRHFLTLRQRQRKNIIEISGQEKIINIVTLTRPCCRVPSSSVVEPFNFGPAPASQDGGFGSSQKGAAPAPHHCPALSKSSLYLSYTDDINSERPRRWCISFPQTPQLAAEIKISLLCCLYRPMGPHQYRNSQVFK